jgi:hypothetical protein
MAGRKQLRKRFGSTEVGVISFPSRSIYLDTTLRFNFQSTSEVEEKKKLLKTALNEFYLDYPLADPSATPIISFNEPTSRAIEATFINKLVISVMFFLRRPINEFEDIHLELFKKLVNELGS